MNEQAEVPGVEGVDLDFTPKSYFTERDLGLALPSDILGKARRDIARRLAAEDEELPFDLIESALSELERAAIGRIHPLFMGGEYLPPLREGEVEIARISLQSVTADQISVRASRTADGIEYSIVDEYEDLEVFDVRPRVTAGPLPMRGLVAMLDGAREGGGLVVGYIAMNADSKEDAARLLGFVSVESDFYPDLGRYYEERIARWYAALPGDGEDDDEDEE